MMASNPDLVQYIADQCSGAGAKDYFYISDVDDRDYLAGLIKATIPSLPKPKAKKNPMK